MRKVVFALGAVMMLLSLYLISGVSNAQQVIVQADETLPDIREMDCAVHAVCSSAVMVGNSRYQMSGQVYAVNERYTEVYPLFLKTGRLFYRTEAQRGGNVCVIEERVAIQLFKTSEPLGGTLSVNGQEYSVIGVVQNSSELGATVSGRVYVPYEGVSGTFDAVIYSSLTGFDETPSGTVISLQKEKNIATLLGRITAVFIGFCVWLLLLRKLTNVLKARRKNLHAQLEHRYFGSLFVPTALWTVLFLVCALSLVAALYLLLSFLLAPLFVLTEWVPEVLVEWSSIRTTFLQNVRSLSGIVSLRTQEMLRIRIYGVLMNVGSVLVLMSNGRKYQCKKSCEKASA